MMLRMLLICAAVLGLTAAAKAAEEGSKQQTPPASTAAEGSSQQAPAANPPAESSRRQQTAAPKHGQHAARKPAPYGNDCCGAGEVYRHIYAEAWYGNQKVTAPVRHVGCCDQVQLPTGEWIDCVFTCEIALRKMPLWYWQDQGGYNKWVTPAYPREGFWIDPWGYRHSYLF